MTRTGKSHGDVAMLPTTGDPELDKLIEVARFLPPGHIRALTDAALIVSGFPEGVRYPNIRVAGGSLGQNWLGRLKRGVSTLSPRDQRQALSPDDLLAVGADEDDRRLLSPQGRALAEAESRAKAVSHAADFAGMEILRDVVAFESGETGLRIDIPDVGYSGILRPADLPSFMGALGDDSRRESVIQARVRLMDPMIGRPESAEPMDEELLDKSRERAGSYYNLLRDGLHDEILDVLAARGVIRGPCSDCGRPAWVPIYSPRNPKGGRRPLSDRLCPACMVSHLQQRQASKQRTYRAKGGQRS